MNEFGIYSKHEHIHLLVLDMNLSYIRRSHFQSRFIHQIFNSRQIHWCVDPIFHIYWTYTHTQTQLPLSIFHITNKIEIKSPKVKTHRQLSWHLLCVHNFGIRNFANWMWPLAKYKTHTHAHAPIHTSIKYGHLHKSAFKAHLILFKQTTVTHAITHTTHSIDYYFIREILHLNWFYS